MIEFININKKYENRKNLALKNINIRIKDGEFVFVVGSSGAGKSTLVKLLLRQVEPTSGEILIDREDIGKIPDRRIPFMRRKMGVVFQDFRLLEKKTVFENVAFAMEIIGASKLQINRQVPQALGLVGLDGKEHSYPNELSGGEQQRVSLARAIINKPRLVIADEPTGNLDPDTAWGTMHALEEINKIGTTVLMVTHAKEIVDVMQKRVIALEDGRIIRDEEKGGYGYED